MVARIERRRRIVRRKRRRRGLADDARTRLSQHRHHRRIRARLPAFIDRRAHFSRKVRRIDNVLDADRNAAQRPGTCRADRLGAAHKGADGFVMSLGRLTRLGNRRIGRKLAGIDPALEFGKRHHWHYSPAATGPLLRSARGSGKRPSRHSEARKAAHPGMTGVNPLPTPSG